MFSKEIFGQRLKAIRKEKKETQDDLALILDVGKSHISEMERGNRTTTAEKIALICEHYRVSADYLLGLSDDPNPRYGRPPRAERFAPPGARRRIPPPIFFSSCRKENGPWTVQKKRALFLTNRGSLVHPTEFSAAFAVT